MKLFWEDFQDAARDDVNACGGTKAVASILFPEKDVDAAARYFLDCLNPARSEKLGPDHVRLLSKLAAQKGSYAIVYHTCDECNLERPNPTNPEDEKARLQREVISAVDELNSLVSRLERVK